MIDASTGPTPVLAVSFSTPSISSLTVAVGETLAPIEMLKPLMTIGVSFADPSSVIAIAIKFHLRQSKLVRMFCVLDSGLPNGYNAVVDRIVLIH